MKNLVTLWSAIAVFGVAVMLIDAATQVNRPSPSLASSLKVDVKAAQTTVKNSEHLVIHTRISNTSNETQTLQVWSCSYDKSWTSDQQGVSLDPVPCRANAPIPIFLKPNETYERELSVYAWFRPKNLPQESITFHLAFKPWIDPPVKSPFIWSNPITIKVIP